MQVMSFKGVSMPVEEILIGVRNRLFGMAPPHEKTPSTPAQGRNINCTEERDLD